MGTFTLLVHKIWIYFEILRRIGTVEIFRSNYWRFNCIISKTSEWSKGSILTNP